MTGRDLVKGKDERESLQIGSSVSKAVLEFANGLKVRPRFVIAKVRAMLVTAVATIN